MSLPYQVYTGEKRVGALLYAEDAAALASALKNTRVKVNGRIVWREGHEQIGAGESYDHAAEIMRDRVKAHNLEFLAKYKSLAERGPV